MAKIGPHSFLIETESEILYRRNHKFIREDPSQEQASLDSSGTYLLSQRSPNEESPNKSLPDAKADSPLKQAPTMRQTHESHQPKSTSAEEIVTLHPQQTVGTRSGRTSVGPSRFDHFVT